MTNQPRFVNLGTMPVNVSDERGNQRVVRPFRELQAMPWRTEQECVCVGAHYAKFPGLLEPFPGDETQAAASDAPAKGPTFRFRLSGEVIRAGEASVASDDATASVATPSTDAAVDEAQAVAAADENVKPNAPVRDDLESVAGMTATLAAALRDNGYATAAQLADCQSLEELRELAQVPGVKTVKFATKLAEAAQDLLGWE